MGLRIDTSSTALDSYRALAVPPRSVDRPVTSSDTPTAPPAPRTPAPGDNAETRATGPTKSLASDLRSAQEAIGAAEETDGTLGRAYDILVTLRGLVSQGLVDGRPPAETASERQYLSLLGELADLGRAAPVFDPPPPSRTELTQIARDLKKSQGTGIDQALASVEHARSSVAQDRQEIRRSLNALSVALENKAAAHSRITDAAMAREASDLVRAGILGSPRSAVAAQSTTPREALRLLHR